MAKIPGNNSTEGGLELDEISISGIAPDSSQDPKAGRGPEAGGPASSAPEDTPRGKKKVNLPLMIFLGVLVLLMALTAVFKKQDFSISRLTGSEKGASPLESYLRIGPVTTTLVNEDIVKFSIDIDCKTPELKAQIAGKDSQIRDDIIAVLTDPETGALIARRDFEAVKVRLKERFGDLPVGDIYFSELLLY